ncbi:c-type cytochrome [Mesorhizobium amorphae]|uniref:Cytochrome c n=1 Tax=Mesorhizobium amorphae CCNWGS0123 TaxID=1082933 RepID=G6YD51_9HYPH|nr:cytochrome c family protein [Mesorhizobium amorphae]ANT52201.1 cytochrome C [Mesorhizobium amorphae CCNWGS0123]EHH10523.1 cytochrome c [Mesorhizobium amorphae CCNWGS0123]GLR44874.1 cytochrome C protein [Mesorhizobium amorphae]
MRAVAFLAVVFVATFFASQSQAQDAAAGEKVFTKCKACHVADEDKNKIGPSLHGVIGRTAGTHPDFKYSEAMVAAGTSGVKWDEPTLASYLHDPKAMVKGTKMVFPGLKKDEDVANVIAYLKQFSP